MASRIYNRINDKKKKRLTAIYHKYLVNYLTETGEKSQKASQKIQQLTRSNKKNKMILLKSLLDLNYNFSGGYSTKTNELYHTLQLYSFSREKLKSPFWSKKVKGVYELSSMEDTDSYDMILPLSNHRNPNVRRAARVALVTLNKKQGLLDLKDTYGEISKWTQICIISILKREPTKLSETEINLLKMGDNKYINELGTELDKLNYAH